jgi:hypothetical protein
MVPVDQAQVPNLTIDHHHYQFHLLYDDQKVHFEQQLWFVVHLENFLVVNDVHLYIVEGQSVVKAKVRYYLMLF